MRDRLVTLACALGALALFYTLFFSQPDDPGEVYPRPTTVEVGSNGYAAALRWLQGASVRVLSLRQRYDALARSQMGLAAQGNLLITTAPHHVRARTAEYRQLSEWVRAGNTLVVMAALADTPDWTIRLLGSDLPEEARQLTGVGFVVPPPDPRPEAKKLSAAEAAQELADDLRRLAQPKRHRIVPNRAHPLFEGVRQVVAESEFPAAQWRALPSPDTAILSLAHDADTGRDALWVRNLDEGRVIVSAFGSLFANEQLDEPGNARLLANIVAQSLGPQGAVLFDDQHHGVSELYDGAAFFADRRLHLTLILLLVSWLIWAVGSVRLRPAAVEPPAPRETAFVEATGGFLARAVHPVQAGMRLVELFFNDLRRRLNLNPNGRPVWEWLERHPRVTPAELQALRQQHERLAEGKRVDLVRLQNLLVSLQGKV